MHRLTTARTTWHSKQFRKDLKTFFGPNEYIPMYPEFEPDMEGEAYDRLMDTGLATAINIWSHSGFGTIDQERKALYFFDGREIEGLSWQYELPRQDEDFIDQLIRGFGLDSEFANRFDS